MPIELLTPALNRLPDSIPVTPLLPRFLGVCATRVLAAYSSPAPRSSCSSHREVILSALIESKTFSRSAILASAESPPLPSSLSSMDRSPASVRLGVVQCAAAVTYLAGKIMLLAARFPRCWSLRLVSGLKPRDRHPRRIFVAERARRPRRARERERGRAIRSE